MTRKLLALLGVTLAAMLGAEAPVGAAPAGGDHDGPAVTVNVNDLACGDWTFDLVPHPDREDPIHVKYRLGPDGDWQHVTVDPAEGYVTVDVPGPGATEVTWKIGRHGPKQTFTGGHECPPPTTGTTAPAPTTETPPTSETPTTLEPSRPPAGQPDCGDLADAGVDLPLTPDDADWADVLDGDGDGLACEGWVNGTTSTTATPTSSGRLPRTGSTVGPMIAAGLGLLVVGGALVIGKRHLGST